MNRPSFLKNVSLGKTPVQATSAEKQKNSPPLTSGTKKAPGLYQRLAHLYQRMENAYAACAREAGLSCAGCPTNCCTSFFQHHTYVEWSYLWRGLSELAPQRRQELIRRAENYMRDANQAIALNALPNAMCPLNEEGLCILYPYRLMICRLHGTRNVFTRPDGFQQVFPGCARFTALPCSTGNFPSAPASETPTAPPQNAGASGSHPCPTLDRTPFYAELAALEMEFHKRAAGPLPRVNLTLAEMIVLGPPRLR